MRSSWNAGTYGKRECVTGAALSNALSTCAALLQQVGEPFWSDKLTRIAARHPDISQGDAQELLSWFGGMGSFNDLVISIANGHDVTEEQEPAMNSRLDELRRRIYECATAVRWP